MTEYLEGFGGWRDGGMVEWRMEEWREWRDGVMEGTDGYPSWMIHFEGIFTFARVRS